MISDHQGVGLVVCRIFPKAASLGCFLTTRSPQTQQGAHIWPIYNPFNLFSWQIHSSWRPQGIWCCLHEPKEKVTSHSKPPCDITWPQICPIVVVSFFFSQLFSLHAFKNNRDLECMFGVDYCVILGNQNFFVKFKTRGKNWSIWNVVGCLQGKFVSGFFIQDRNIIFNQNHLVSW